MPVIYRLPFWLRRLLWWQRVPPPKPGPLAVVSMEEVIVLRYTVNLPPAPPISDLATREVTISLNADVSLQNCEPAAVSFQFDTDAGVAVILSLVDIDTSGNRSDRSDPLSFTASDTVPPPVPGGMSVAGVEQVEAEPKSTKPKRQP